MEILRIENLSFSYPEEERPAISDISLTINAGEFTVLCGSSGSGKTTLLRMLKNELAPAGKQTGRILFKGADIKTLSKSDSACSIGFVMQDPESQIVTDKVWHELAFGPENLAFPTTVLRRRVAETAGYFGLSHIFDRNTDELSGGQKQLLNLASIMTLHPEILILDEPTSRLDPIAASEFIAVLKKLNTETGITVIIAEHRLEEVFPIADRVVVMEDGKTVFCGSPSRTATELQKANCGKNILPGLPASARLYSALEQNGDAPLTIKDGRDYLTAKVCGKKYDLPVKEPESSTETVLELKDVYFRYEKNSPDVLKKLSVNARKGEVFAILGDNGAGKTTLLGCISGLLKPHSGVIKINGKRLRDYKGTTLYRNTLAYLPQDPKAVFIKDTLGEDLTAMYIASGKPKTSADKTITDLAKNFGLGGLLDRHPYDLSGGEQQKAAIAKILLSEPTLILMDEPTKGLDAYSKLQLGQTVRELANEGRTVLTVTHDVEFAAMFADRCALVFDGQIFSEGTPGEFFAENYFYTTAAHRISRGIVDGAVTVEDIISAIKQGQQNET